MKQPKKIHILTPEEAKKEVARDLNAANLLSGDDSGIQTPSYLCPDGKHTISCSGANFKVEYETINKKQYLKALYCYTDGVITGGGVCDNSQFMGSGSSGSSGTVANSAEAACANSTPEASCDWIDQTGMPHSGFCRRDDNRPGNHLICKEWPRNNK